MSIKFTVTFVALVLLAVVIVCIYVDSQPLPSGIQGL